MVHMEILHKIFVFFNVLRIFMHFKETISVFLHVLLECMVIHKTELVEINAIVGSSRIPYEGYVWISARSSPTCSLKLRQARVF